MKAWQGFLWKEQCLLNAFLILRIRRLSCQVQELDALPTMLNQWARSKSHSRSHSVTDVLLGSTRALSFEQRIQLLNAFLNPPDPAGRRRNLAALNFNYQRARWTQAAPIAANRSSIIEVLINNLNYDCHYRDYESEAQRTVEQVAAKKAKEKANLPKPTLYRWHVNHYEDIGFPWQRSTKGEINKNNCFRSVVLTSTGSLPDNGIRRTAPKIESPFRSGRY